MPISSRKWSTVGLTRPHERLSVMFSKIGVNAVQTCRVSETRQVSPPIIEDIRLYFLMIVVVCFSFYPHTKGTHHAIQTLTRCLISFDLSGYLNVAVHTNTEH